MVYDKDNKVLANCVAHGHCDCYDNKGWTCCWCDEESPLRDDKEDDYPPPEDIL